MTVIFQPRSFVLRRGRMTPGQQKGLVEHWQVYGLDQPPASVQFDWQAIFKQDAPRILEIGFGMGDTLISLAKAHPDKNFIGIEVHTPGVGRCLSLAAQQNLTNLRVIQNDAMVILKDHIPAHSLDRVMLFFPDPWPKARQNKRRIVQVGFLQILAKVLKPGGIFQVATDWQPYADHILSVVEQSEDFQNYFGAGQFAKQPFERFETKFERRGMKLGHSIYDMVFARL